MNFDDKVKEVFEKTEVVCIATCGNDGPHLVATWGDYIRKIGIKDEGVIVIPAGGYRKTEENLMSEFLLNAELGVETTISKQLSLRLLVQNRYDSAPVSGSEENDISARMALVYTAGS